MRPGRSMPLRRLVVGAGIVAFVAGAYALIVVAGGVLLSRPAPDLLLAVLATAVVAVGLEPVRRSLVRHLLTSSYDQLAAFTTGLAGVVATDELAPRMARLLAEGTGARRVEIRLGAAETLAARWPPDGAPIEPDDAGGSFGAAEAPVRTAGGRPNGGSAEIRPHVARHDVVHGGERLGVIVRDTGGAAPSPVEQRLLDDLLASAGLALRTIALTADLRQRVAEYIAQAADLRAARARMVTAADAARRRLERDIHDGAQQHLVALAVQLSLAATVARAKPDRARALIAELREAAVSALGTLEDLSRGIYPAALAESGIAAALATASAHSPVPVRVTDRTGRRYPVEIEAAGYFGCLEAVQNAVKHARAHMIDVVLERHATALVVEVSDDGVGFDPQAVAGGSGLANIRDRVEALGGTVTIRSASAAGAAIVALIPLAGVGDE